MTEEKVRENRLRRMARRQGLLLQRSRRRDPLALGYGLYYLTPAEVAAREVPAAGLTLEQVERFLTG